MSKLLDRFTEKATLIGPMEEFEPFSGDHLDLARAIFKKFEALSRASEAKAEKAYSWLEFVACSAGRVFTPIFYGKVVYGDLNEIPSDIDVLFFVPHRSSMRDDEMLAYSIVSSDLPKFIHPQFLFTAGFAEDTIATWKRLCVVNNLLIISDNPDQELLDVITEGRRLVSQSPFFGGGLGELLTYSAFKILDSKEEKYLVGEERSILGKDFSVDMYDTQSAPLSPTDLNREIRRAIREKFDENELKVLGMAASRRIRIRHDKREALVSRFVSEMVPCK